MSGHNIYPPLPSAVWAPQNGQANDGANIGDGVGLVYSDKSGVTLRYRSIKAAEGGLVTVAAKTDIIELGADAAAIVGTASLGDLSDVNTTGAAAGQALTFTGAEWVPTDTIAFKLKTSTGDVKVNTAAQPAGAGEALVTTSSAVAAWRTLQFSDVSGRSYVQLNSAVAGAPTPTGAAAVQLTMGAGTLSASAGWAASLTPGELSYSGAGAVAGLFAVTVCVALASSVPNDQHELFIYVNGAPTGVTHRCGTDGNGKAEQITMSEHVYLSGVSNSVSVWIRDLAATSDVTCLTYCVTLHRIN